MSATASPRSSGSIRGAIRWLRAGLPWLLLLGLVTVAFVAVRGRADMVYEVLGYLLVVLGASSRRGRTWGLTVAVLAFLCFDFFLLPPYHTLALADPLDWVVLGSFLVTSVVAAQLLDRAQREARDARARAEEVNRFAAVGAEALAGGRAEEGVEAVARILWETLEVRRCAVYSFDAQSGTVRAVAAAGREGPDKEGEGGADLVRYAARNAALAVTRPLGETHVEPADGHLARVLGELPASRGMLIPLVARGRTVGVLRLTGAGKQLEAGEVRFVEALAYYAALAVERVRLVGEAERAFALNEADRLKDALLAAVSHDLRTPLTTIKALAEEMRPREEAAATIVAEAERLNRFVADLLDLSRLESGSVALRREIVPADDLVGAAIQQVSASVPGRVIEARVPTSEFLFGDIDFMLALRSLTNVLENACKYSTGGPVEVTVARDGGTLVFAVADRGPGVPEEERTRIFEPFFRGRYVPDGMGTGLGLSIAQRLARAQGGDLHHTPRPGGGSVFALTFPAADLSFDVSALA